LLTGTGILKILNPSFPMFPPVVGGAVNVAEFARWLLEGAVDGAALETAAMSLTASRRLVSTIEIVLEVRGRWRQGRALSTKNLNHQENISSKPR
jgi:hypothetical protein